MSNPVRILMVDDHPVVLAGLKAVVAQDPAIEIAGEARDGAAALAMVRTCKPDVVVLDLSLPGLNGRQVAETVGRELPGSRVLVLTAHDDRAYIRELLKAGVSGYLLKRSAAEELVRAIHVVAGGGVYLDPVVAAVAVGRGQDPSSARMDANDASLSERESDVLRMVAGGHSNKEVAAALEISIKTVETYRARAMEKLGLRTRVDLVRHAARRGWLQGR
jgi:DNA-binding NarL/FixJ family response regulator